MIFRFILWLLDLLPSSVVQTLDDDEPAARWAKLHARANDGAGVFVVPDVNAADVGVVCHPDAPCPHCNPRRRLDRARPRHRRRSNRWSS